MFVEFKLWSEETNDNVAGIIWICAADVVVVTKLSPKHCRLDLREGRSYLVEGSIDSVVERVTHCIMYPGLHPLSPVPIPSISVESKP
jgi:hypothetical protein